VAFTVSRTTSRITMAAAVRARKSDWGFVAQLKMSVGIEVYPWSVRICSANPADPAEKKPVTAPTSSSGAVSPRARARVSTVPVKIPGAAEGMTWLRTTSHRVAPTP